MSALYHHQPCGCASCADGCRHCSNTGRVELEQRPGYDMDCPSCQGGPSNEMWQPDPACSRCHGWGTHEPLPSWCSACWPELQVDGGAP